MSHSRQSRSRSSKRTFRRRPIASPLTSLVLMSLLSACTVGPDYVRPDVATPATFKENRDWTVAAPADDEPRGQWWRIYGDPDLDALEDQVGSNQSIAQADASYRAALALVDAARSAYFPTVSAQGSISRSGNRGTSGNSRGSSVAATSVASTVATTSATSVSDTVVTSSSVSTVKSASLNVSWEIDLWGRVRRQVESQQASADASASDLAGIVLSTQAAVASDYFQLRQLDTQKQLLDDTITAYQRTLDVTRNRYAGGVSARVDVAQAETQLKTTQVQAIDVGIARAQFEHAIALLIGKSASDFSIQAKRWTAFSEKRAPRGPDQRPAVATAAAAPRHRGCRASCRVGRTRRSACRRPPTIRRWPCPRRAATRASASPDLFSRSRRASGRSGPSVAQTLFDGGLRRAQTEAGRSRTTTRNVAAYRQTVLSGFAEVEDQLAALRILEREGSAQDDVLASARESLALTINQYKAGTVSYTNVVTVQATALANERNAVSIFGSRMVASVNLVRDAGRQLGRRAVTRGATRMTTWVALSDWVLAQVTRTDTRSRHRSLGIVTALTLLIGAVDYASGIRISLAVFYLVPVLLATAWLGWRAGVACAFASVLLRIVGGPPVERRADAAVLESVELVHRAADVPVHRVDLQPPAGALPSARTARRGTHRGALDRGRTTRAARARPADDQRARTQQPGSGAARRHLPAPGRDTALAAKVLAQRLASRDPELARPCGTIVEMVEEGIAKTRRLAKGLLLSSVEPHELAERLNELVDESARAGVASRFEQVGELRLDDPAVTAQMFRIAQEATRNALRHSGARRIDVSLVADANEVCLTIEDDGSGLPEPRAASGLGLQIMSHRAAYIGATLSLVSTAGRGTRVVCHLPLADLAA